MSITAFGVSGRGKRTRCPSIAARGWVARQYSIIINAMRHNLEARSAGEAGNAKCSLRSGSYGTLGLRVRCGLARRSVTSLLRVDIARIRAGRQDCFGWFLRAISRGRQRQGRSFARRPGATDGTCRARHVLCNGRSWSSGRDSHVGGAYGVTPDSCVVQAERRIPLVVAVQGDRRGSSRARVRGRHSCFGLWVL